MGGKLAVDLLRAVQLSVTLHTAGDEGQQEETGEHHQVVGRQTVHVAADLHRREAA